MPVKQPDTLSRADFDEAVVRLRLNVSEIAKETGIPRTYLSEFRNGDRRLRPEHQAKLRDFFEARGVEFEPERDQRPDTEDAASDRAAQASESARAAPAPHTTLRRLVAERCYFPIADNLPESVVLRALETMEATDARILDLMRSKAEHDESLWGNGEFTEDTRRALGEAYTLLAGNYLLFRILRGFGGVAGLNDQRLRGTPGTVGRVIFEHYAQPLSEAGLVASGERDGAAAPDGDPPAESESQDNAAPRITFVPQRAEGAK